MSRKVLRTNLHQKLNYKFDRRTIMANGVNDIWACDLIDMNSEQLNKSGYIINCVDVFSRYAQAVRLKTKSLNDIQQGFNELFTLFGAKPTHIWSDKEASIIASKNWLSEQNIDLYHVENSYMGAGSHSVSIVERFNRTMKEAMMQYKTELNSGNWGYLINYTIENFIPEYNDKVHSTLGITPNEAYTGQVNQKEIFREQDERATEKKKQPKEILKVGTRVHLQKPKEIIRGKKETKYYKQVEVINGIKKTNPITYTLEGYGDTGFYRQQFILAKEVDIPIDELDFDFSQNQSLRHTDIESEDEDEEEEVEPVRRSARIATRNEAWNKKYQEFKNKK